MSLVIHENLDFALLHHTNTRVGGSEINTDDCRRAISICSRVSSALQMPGRLTSAIALLYWVLVALCVCRTQEPHGKEKSEEEDNGGAQEGRLL